MTHPRVGRIETVEKAQMAEREAMEFDVVVVGAGPAASLPPSASSSLPPRRPVCVVEKGSEVGAHILSGAVIEPRALDELLPDWRTQGAPLTTEAKDDRFLYLTATRAPPGADAAADAQPRQPDRLARRLCRWLAVQAEGLGVEIYPGFAAAELLEQDGRIVGVATGEMGVEKSGEHGPNYQPGMELRAVYTLFAEGCRGSLSKRLMARFGLRQGVDPQTYALGIKELWEMPARGHRPGLVEHSIGCRSTCGTYGGSFLYHFGDNLVSYGFVVGLDYRNPWLSPFEEMQRLKTHPAMRGISRAGGGSAYGARALSEGGSIDPEADLPGRRADRRRGGVPQRAQDQGHARGDEVRDAGGRGGGGGAWRAAASAELRLP